MASGSNLFGSRLFKSCKLWGGSSKDKTCLSRTSRRCSIGFRSGEVFRSTLQTHHSSKHFCPLPCYRGHSTQIKSTTMIMFMLCVCEHCRQENPLKSTPTISVHNVGFGQCTHRKRNKVWPCDSTVVMWSPWSHQSSPWFPGTCPDILHSCFLTLQVLKLRYWFTPHFCWSVTSQQETVDSAHAYRIHLVLCMLSTYVPDNMSQ